LGESESIVVTGAAGFIGSNVVAALNEAGNDDLILCDRLREDQRWLNLRKRSFRDLVHPEELITYLTCWKRPPKALIHLGANSSTTSIDGDELMRVNFRATLNLLDYCTEKGVNFIYASSAATYGDGANGFIDEFSLTALKKLRPLNLYAFSKHLIDKIIAERSEKGLPLPPKCIGLKYFNVYGQNEYHKGDMISVVGKNYSKVLAGEPIELFKSHREGIEDGAQHRDFIYVDDAVSVTLWFLERGPNHGLYNVGTGEGATFREMAEALCAALGKPPEIRYAPMPHSIRDRYQYYSRASLENLRSAGYSERFSDIEEGVSRYAAYLGSADRYR
jgi:ADP-L-glycero-D-manno-heptose 6-epimerase